MTPADKKEFIKDFPKIKKSVQRLKVDVFEGNGEISMAKMVEYLKDIVRGTFVPEDHFDTSEIAAGISDWVRNEISDWGYDPDDVEIDLPEKFEELIVAADGALNWNWDSILPSVVLVRDENPVYLEGGVTSDSNWTIFVTKAMKFGVTDAKKIQAAMSNMYGDCVAGVGILTSGADVWDGDNNLKGLAVAYIWNRLEGSAAYVIANRPYSRKIDHTKLPDLIDHGNNSIGAIYRTDEWQWK